MSKYLINDIFYTIQGEGYWTGRAAVFVRFARCNLWSGREKDRASAICQFCDTDFVDATRMTLEEVKEAVFKAWPMKETNPMVVFTGGEPLLQLDNELIWEIKNLGFYTAVETNGTVKAPESLDWICVSPKILSRLVVQWANEIKLVYPQLGVPPENLVYFPAEVRWLSPMDGPDYQKNLEATIDYVKNDPRWRLNIQTHKFIGVK